MKSKFFLIILLFLFPTIVMAQAAGGQVKRPAKITGVPLSPMERRIVGKHLFGCDGITDEEDYNSVRYWGMLTISKTKDGRLVCTGKQFSQKFPNQRFVYIAGDITIKNERTLILNGTIRVKQDMNTREKVHTGKFLFQGNKSAWESGDKVYGKSEWHLESTDDETNEKYQYVDFETPSTIWIFTKLMR